MISLSTHCDPLLGAYIQSPVSLVRDKILCLRFQLTVWNVFTISHYQFYNCCHQNIPCRTCLWLEKASYMTKMSLSTLSVINIFSFALLFPWLNEGFKIIYLKKPYNNIHNNASTQCLLPVPQINELYTVWICQSVRNLSPMTDNTLTWL